MLVSGADFYMAPRFSPDGSKLAWVRSMPLHASALFDCHPPVCYFFALHTPMAGDSAQGSLCKGAVGDR